MKTKTNKNAQAVTFAKGNYVLLEQIEKLGKSVEAQCRKGFCGACRTKIIAGKVHYDDEPLAYFDEDEVLVCCAKPQTNVVLSI